MNPYRSLARTTLKALDKLTEPVEREAALAVLFAQAVIKSQDIWRARIQTLEMPLTFNRHEVEHLDNSHHYMQIEMAKALGLAILHNNSVCKLTRDQTDSEVKFTASVAVVPVLDWIVKGELNV
jgi:hypothetical protein